MESLRSFVNNHPVWSVVIGLFILFIVLSAIGSSVSNTPTLNSNETAAAPQTPVQSGPASSFGDGNYVVGTDILPGTYKSSGGQSCYWERLRGFGGTTEDIIANDNTDYSAVVTIASTDKGFDSHNCGTWTRISVPESGSIDKTTSAPVVPTPAAPSASQPPAQQPQTYTTPSGAVVDSQGNLVGEPLNQSETLQTSDGSATQAATPTDYSQFTPTYFYDFAGDPPAYLDSAIEVKGVINNQFLAAGDRGGSSNYIGIADPNGRSTETVMLKISSNADYQKAVAAVQYYDLVAAYGYGVSSQYFTTNGGGETLVPVINVVRLDDIGACGPSGCGEGSDTTVFP